MDPSTIPGWSEYLDPGQDTLSEGVCGSQYYPGMVRVSGSQDTLTEGGVRVPVMSRDGQSISGSWDTLTK